MAHGMPPFPNGGPIVGAGRIIRYGPKKRAWYTLHEYTTRAGSRVIAGAFGVWGRLDATRIEIDWGGMPAEERARLEAQRREAEERERTKREERAAAAANRARQQWRAAQQLGSSPYLDRKGVKPESALRFFADGTLLVPMLRFDTQKLVGLQKIAPDGMKRFNRHMAKEGAACRLGAAPKDGEPVVIAEGVATALSIRMALERRVPVFIAFDCGNLAPVARLVRKLVPNSLIVFAADDDYATEGNPGTEKATAAMREVGNARVAVPVFKVRAVDSGWTDFNDLHQAEGLEAVARQLSKALSSPSDAAAPGSAQGAANGTGRSRIDWGVVDRLLEHYVLIRGTDTVWDGENREILTVPTLKLAEGAASVNYWLTHDRRRTVLRDRVVFDPTCQTDAETSINLFDRDEIRRPSPGDGRCERMLWLLQYLCGERDQDQAPITDWVLRWLAYPLQHTGAKMQTALVMAGPEGTGKNLFFGCIKQIYGRYGAIITQTEIESPYTAWRSRKLFIIANEVLSRQEMRHQVGKLRNLVTEGELPIDEKYMPLRYEANHVNLCFFSNELQPLFIAKDDRRYTVVRTPDPLPPECYSEVAAEAEAGGVDALHAYLLALDLGDFKPWTKPPMTGAKEALIELGLSSVELFHREWSTGLTPWPYCAALSDDVYRAYRKFCEERGERMPVKENRFWPELLTLDRTARKVVLRVIDPDPQALGGPRQRRVFIVGAPAEGEAQADWVKTNLLAFRDALGGAK